MLRSYPLLLRSYSAPTPLLLRSYSAPTPLLLRSYSAPTPLLLRSYSAPISLLLRSYWGSAVGLNNPNWVVSRFPASAAASSTVGINTPTSCNVPITS
ncbi:hypothetical protein BV898_04786 [Hypsibius exemplaris]|uniref:Uncharacterized protein n=1 Tax=Hypsibius exemplaris TaxID=2072580 RepID=A0A1W0X1W0_HYPEX|nr:hypothetical protein BV898_04786 [Hypsibius exemplaris]